LERKFGGLKTGSADEGELRHERRRPVEDQWLPSEDLSGDAHKVRF
jgi:hypothetical protein